MSNPHRTNRAFLGAYRKGRAAARSNADRTPPYEDRRGGCHGHVITYSRTFRKVWLEGFDDERSGAPERYTTSV